jgi:hypothetical protein
MSFEDLCAAYLLFRDLADGETAQFCFEIIKLQP